MGEDCQADHLREPEELQNRPKRHSESGEESAAAMAKLPAFQRASSLRSDLTLIRRLRLPHAASLYNCRCHPYSNLCREIVQMTLLYCPPCFLDHETGNHPERADRIRHLPERLAAAGLSAQCRTPEFQPVSRQRLARVHSPAYIDEVWAYAKSGGGYIEPDTVVSPASYDVALMAAGSVCDAVERLVRGEDTQALCLVRPPGHHAMVNHAMGFCMFNNIAVAARLAVDVLGLDRVLIVDWDIHHGNGTQAAFWEDPKVGFLSIHRWPFFPGTGDSDETGGGRGLARRSICPSNSARRGKTISRCSATASKNSPPRSSRSWCC